MCANFLNLRAELDLMVAENINLLHIDIMDGQYVPNFTLGTDLANSLYEYSGIALDYHLMIESTDSSVPLFTKNPGTWVTFHPETSRHPVRVIQQIRDAECYPGIAIDPGLSLDAVKYLLPLVDMVCVMTVNPGFAGQKLLPFCLEKISELNEWRKNHRPTLRIEVDGNVSWENIPPMLKAGADVLVLGTSSVFNQQQSRPNAYEKLFQLISQNLPAQ